MHRVNPSIRKPLLDALSRIFWYKKELADFLVSTVNAREITDSIDLAESKREFASRIVSTLFEQQHRYHDNLIDLIVAAADVEDPDWLLRDVDEDGHAKYLAASRALRTLRKHAEPVRLLKIEAAALQVRVASDRARAEALQERSRVLASLRGKFEAIEGLENRQERGYVFESFLHQLFTFSDIDARGPFRTQDEQIDGAFSLDGTDYLLEAKWQAKPTQFDDIILFNAKVDRKLDNTLGLFVSRVGFHQRAVERLDKQERSRVLLMDGRDLMAVLEDRFGLADLIKIKRQHAAHTGGCFLEINDAC